MHVLRRVLAPAAAATAVALLVVMPAAAHVVKQIGPYEVAIGWVHEPTYTGQENAVQVLIHDQNGQPVTDLGPDDLKVVVSTGGQQSDPLALTATYDEDTGLGLKGDYEATIIPTAPGDYTFHVTGTIHDQAVDVTVTSSDSTFDSVVDPTAIQFPDQLPALGDVVTRVDRVDSRITSASNDASKAQSAATVALVVGVAVGGIGVLVGATGLLVAARGRRRVAS
jgi:hypothetical protein